MIKRNKIISLLLICMTLIFTCSKVAAATPKGKITSFNVNNLGVAEIMGYVESDKTEQMTILMTTDENTFTNDTIMYINQFETGNNGTFYLSFAINEKFTQSPYFLFVGSSVEGFTPLKLNGILPTIPFEIEGVANNALRVGRDIYDIGCDEYTPDNIVKSLKNGGNVIYFKLGDNWYDLLNENITSNEYFNDGNITPKAEIKKWNIDNYYKRNMSLL